jgi:hypothetical protein
MRSRWSSVLVLQFPLVTLLIIAACAVGFLLELSRGPELPSFLFHCGVVPIRAAAYFENVPGTTFTNSVVPFFSSLFLHAGWVHLLVNLFFLWMVSDALESYLGAGRYVLLFIVCAAAELIVRCAVASAPPGYPSIGISGAVAGLIGGCFALMARLAPREASGRSALFALRDLPVLVGPAVWFPLQLLNGYLPITAQETCQTVETSWWGLGVSLLLGIAYVSLSAPREDLATVEAAPPSAIPLQGQTPAADGEQSPPPTIPPPPLTP